MAFVVLLFPSEKAEAQTYNAVWITGLNASPNPMLSGVESTTITIDTLEYAQWFWLSPTTMVRPTVILWIAGRPFVATMTYEWMGDIGFWGWWYYWWFNQVGTWTHQVQWDGRDLQRNLVSPGPYLATVEVYAGAAYTFGSIVINVESPIDVKITSPLNNSNIALNADTTFVADVTPSQYINQIQWSGGESPSTGTGGTFTSRFNIEGIKTITATVTAGSQSDTDSIQVNVLSLDYIKVTPLDAKVPVGRTYNFTAMGYSNGQNGMPEDGGGDDIPIYITPSWTVTNNIGTANPVSGSQSTTFSAVSSLPLGVGKIKGQIIATAAGVSGFADVEVYEPRLAQVIVEPVQSTILVGESVTFGIKAYDQEGRLWDYGGLSYQWYLNDIILDGQTGSTLTYTFNEAGKFKVKVAVNYKDQMKEGQADIEVLTDVGVDICGGQALQVLGTQGITTLAVQVSCTLIPQYLCVGSQIQLSYTGTPSGGTAVWNTSNPNIATVSSTGLLTAVAPGTATVTVVYTYKGQTTSSSVTVTIIGVDITQADITNDRIQINLGPNGLSGVLTVTLVGATGSSDHQIINKNMAGGTYNESFDIPGLPESEFTGVRAIWRVQGFECSDEYGYHFKVIGDYLHTRYNTPTESFCTGNNVSFNYTAGDCVNVQCNWNTSTARAGWLNEVQENGSGYSETFGYISREWVCQNSGIRLRRVPDPCPQCGGTLGVGVSVARNRNNPDLPCNARVYVHEVGVVTVQDAGGGLAMDQLDHYAGTSGCNRTAGTIGRRKTIRLFDE